MIGNQQQIKNVPIYLLRKRNVYCRRIHDVAGSEQVLQCGSSMNSLYVVELNCFSQEFVLNREMIALNLSLIGREVTKLSPKYISLVLDTDTVVVLIKLTIFAVALRLRCGSCKLIF